MCALTEKKLGNWPAYMQARVVFMSFIFLNLRCQPQFLDNKQNSNKKN